jgi:hypothetical protein
VGQSKVYIREDKQNCVISGKSKVDQGCSGNKDFVEIQNLQRLSIFLRTVQLAYEHWEVAMAALASWRISHGSRC